MQKLFINNRQRFIATLKDNAIGIVFANESPIVNGDAHYPYEQNTNLLWLTGIAQEKTIYCIIKKKGNIQEYLFIKRPNPKQEIWEGKCLSKEEAKEQSGLNNILYEEAFSTHLQSWMHSIEHVYLNLNENDRKVVETYTIEHTWVEHMKKNYPLHQYIRMAPLLKALRMVKNAEEIECIKAAINITKATFLHILQSVKPNINERQIDALIHYHFILNGATCAFHNIIASGDNARILHYIANNQPCKNNDLVLIDFGARYHYYNADITRTIPISGKFNKRQANIYNACLHLHNYAKSLLKPGVLLSKYTDQIGIEASKTFINLGLLSENDIKNQDNNNPAYKKYLYHGISHHLGLDVHDLSERQVPLTEGMVLTVEPGIYIEEEHIGIRLENDVMITKNACLDLAKDIPITTTDIESYMKA